MIERYCDICGKKMKPGDLRFKASIVWDGPEFLFCDIDTQNIWEDVCRSCAGDIIRDISDLSIRRKAIREDKHGYEALEPVKGEDAGKIDELRADIRDTRPCGGKR